MNQIVKTILTSQCHNTSGVFFGQKRNEYVMENSMLLHLLLFSL